MRPFTYFRIARIIPAVFASVLFVIVSPLLVILFLDSELSLEARFHKTYGANWRAEYEQVHGSLAAAHTKLAVATVGLVVIVALMVWLYRTIRHKRHSHSRHSSHRSGHHHRTGLASRSVASAFLIEAVFGHFAPIAHWRNESDGNQGVTAHQFFSSLMLVSGLGLGILASLIGFARFVWWQRATEAEYRSIYGANWRGEYEQAYEPLATAHTKLALSAAGFVVVSVLAVWLWKLLRRRKHSGHSSDEDHRSRSTPSGSPLERATAYRKKAIPRIYFGVIGILLGVFLVIFRTGICQDHTNEIVLGIFVFLAGYAGVIAGCSSWLKAKQCNEAIILIGLMPLAYL